MEVKSWVDLNLSSGVMSAINELGFTTLTPVQASCIPLFLHKMKDVAVEAVTGSGKTLAFLIPVFEILLKKAPFKKQEIAAIIISPTRELASQTAEVTDLFLKHLPQFSSILLIGGEMISSDVSKILNDGCNILISTPGRLLHLLSSTEELKLNLAACAKTLEVLVLDEADKLLDMGFEGSINAILQYLPKQRRTGLFSATQTKYVEDLIRAGLRNPVCITVKQKGTEIQKTPLTLSNFYMVCEADDKFNTLLTFLRSHKQGKFIIFFCTCASVDYFSCILTKLIKHMPVMSIHGKIKKNRQKRFSNFRNCENGIILCTDVMARGIDIPDVNWVIQYDPPSSASSFVHRCGRTARIGKMGNALVMLLPNEETFINFLSINQSVTLDKMDFPSKVVDVLPKIKKLAAKDREIYEKGMRAFVSHIRFYTKHECNLLFHVKDLDLGKLANGYALLKLPIMPELKNKPMSDFVPTEINYDNIPYTNKSREKMRKERLKDHKSTAKDTKRLLAKKKKPWCKSKEMEAQKKLKKQEKKRKRQEAEKDLEELARDASLLKKLKLRKISQKEFDEKFFTDLD